MVVDATGHVLGLATPPRARILTREVILDVTLTPKARPRDTRWGVIVGDVVHNLASALDNLVWALAHANPHRPTAPPPTANHTTRNAYTQRWRALAFPYSRKREDWEGIRARCLSLVDPALHSIFEDAQPFAGHERTGEDPDLHPLWVLHELWNRDKHRTVNLTAAASGYTGARVWVPGIFPDPSQLTVETLAAYGLQPIVGTTKVATIRVRLPRAVELPTRFDAQLTGDFTLAMLFGEGAPAQGEMALQTLRKARNAVADLLNTFD